MRTMARAGSQLIVNGQPKQPSEFFGAEGFMFCQWAASWIRGSKLPSGERVDAWGVMNRILEEDVKELGCSWFRVPFENEGWGPPYFNHPDYPNHQGLVDISTGVGGSELPEFTKKIIRLYVILARRHGIIFNIPIIWTTKEKIGGSRDPRLRLRNPRTGKPWGDKGISVWCEHFIADVLRYARHLEKNGDGEGNNRVDAGPLNLWFSLVNEFTVTRYPLSRAQVLAILDRAKQRQGKPEFGDWPNELLSISQSGDPEEYAFKAPGEVSHIEPHFPRSGTWAQNGANARHIWPTQAIVADESMMLWAKQDQDDWIPKIPKWAGLGTSDVEAWQRMHVDLWKHMIYSQGHTFPHMSIRWHGRTNSGEIVKKAIMELTGVDSGGSGTPPPPPPPPPTGPLKGELQFHVLGNSGVVVFPDGLWPCLVEGGDEKDAKVSLKDPKGDRDSSAVGDDRGVLRAVYEVDLKRPRELWQIESFIGNDRGDVVEADVDVYAADAVRRGERLYHRSLHKEDPFSVYDAWNGKPVNATVSRIIVHLTYRVNGDTHNDFRKKKENYGGLGLKNRLSARAHFGVELYWRE